MFAMSNSRREICNTHFNYNKSLPKGNNSERLVFLISRLFDNPKGKLVYQKNYDMSNVKNMVSEISVSYSSCYTQKTKISNVLDSVNILNKMWDYNLINVQEQFCVLFLNQSNDVVGFRCLSTGTINSATVDIKLLFALACKSLSSSIIIAHNHPSGNTVISREDKNLTNKIQKAASYFDIDVLDHIILTDSDYVSFAEEGILKN